MTVTPSITHLNDGLGSVHGEKMKNKSGLLHMLGVYYCWILTHICYFKYKICVILTSYLLLYKSAILNIILLIECLQHRLFHLIHT